MKQSCRRDMQSERMAGSIDAEQVRRGISAMLRRSTTPIIQDLLRQAQVKIVTYIFRRLSFWSRTTVLASFLDAPRFM